MNTSPDMMRLILLLGMLAMMLLAVFYLRQRQLSLLDYAFWGLAAILVPLIGPFLVIWMQPGQTSHQQR